MKITAKKVNKILVEEYNWDEEYINENYHVQQLIKDTLKIVNNILQEQKGIKIK